MNDVPRAPEVLPMWKGRRGLVNTIGCVVIGTACAFALLLATERAVVAPVCQQVAASKGLVYKDFKLVGRKQYDTVVCIFQKPNGTTQDVFLNTLVPYVEALLVGLAMDLEITVLAFILLVAVLRSTPALLKAHGA